MNSIKIFCISLFFGLLAVTGYAQNDAKASFVITDVTLHLGNGKLIEKGAIGVKNGKIEAIGKRVDTKAYDTTIAGNGQHVYPSFIAPNTRLGLEEVEAVRATLDFNEVGNFNPNIRSLIAYNTDSKVIPTVRSNGILIAQVVPQGGRISGQSSVLYTEAYNWEDATVKADGCVHLRWPNRVNRSGWWAAPGPTKANKNYNMHLEAIKMYFDEAYGYFQKEKIEKKNIKFETMNGLFRKEKKLMVHVDDARSILEALELLKTYEVEIVIIGGSQAWQITDQLKSYDVSVILNNVHSLPSRPDDDIDQPFKTPAQLKEAGIKFAFAMEGSWNTRNLPFQAGQAVSFGLAKEDAVSALTLHTAEILGIEDRVGSLEKGKDATFIVSKGDALDMRTSIITDAYIEGRKVDLGNKQKDLYDKYMKKYGLEK